MKLQLYVRAVVATIVPLAGTQCWSASFDCSANKLTDIERTICSDSVLSNLDSRLASIYSALKNDGSPATKSGLVSDQRAWLAQRNACSTSGCILQAYNERISEISSYTRPRPLATESSAVVAPSPAGQRQRITQEGRSGGGISMWVWILGALFLFLMIKSRTFRQGFFRGVTSGRAGADSAAVSRAQKLYCVYEVSQTNLLNQSVNTATNIPDAISWEKRLKKQNPEKSYVVCEVESFNSGPGATVFSI